MRNITVFGDIGSEEQLRDLIYNPLVSGFTTNPTLMKKGGITNYENFARYCLSSLQNVKPDGCISFEVFSDDQIEMKEQAQKIATWGKSYEIKTYVKVPILNIDGTPLTGLIELLTAEGINVNVTAVTNTSQYFMAAEAIGTGLLSFMNKKDEESKATSIISVFAGRIADAGVNPLDIFEEIAEAKLEIPGLENLWASPRQVYNIIEADAVGCDIITMTPELIAKLPSLGEHLHLVALRTSRMFFDDAKKSGFKI